MKTIEELLSENLVALRKAAGFRSREAFAEAAEIPWPTYRDIESGKSWPERKNLTAIASTLAIPEARLFQDPDLAPSPSAKQILDAISDALMARDMLREALRQGAIDQNSKVWTRMLQAGLANRQIVESAEERALRETPVERLMAEADAELSEDTKPPKRRPKA